MHPGWSEYSLWPVVFSTTYPLLPLIFFSYWGKACFFESVDFRPYCYSFLLITITFFSVCGFTAYSISKKYGQENKLEYYGKLQKVGSGIIAYLGVFLNIAVCMFGQDEGILIGVNFLYYIILVAVMFMFILFLGEDLTMDVDIHKKNLKLVVFFQIVGSLVLLVSTCYVSTWKEITSIGLSQLNMIITSSWFFAEFLTANESEFGWNENPVERIYEEDDEDSESSDSDSSVEDTMEPVTE
ncbi:hypothetical protein CAEBREN_14301 [Caenorhabditis brenneri]|uniref:Uncharacterized protein n=1 Tax=Caenorhabditis brenneri TaxID=135651 RepID=G0NIY8_CAEBE|nr:hypothetical protein CAEBREN_14301 [Caenorhabditis brenneri]